jgi:hypothetical protein
MKRNIYTYIAYTALALSATSCGDDFLEKNPPLSVTEDDLYSTELGIEGVYNGVLSRFRSLGVDAVIIADNRSDDFVNYGMNTYYYSEVYNMNVGAASVVNPGYFQGGYLAVNAANILKENLENRSDLPISDEVRKEYISGALFIRDFAWYYLAQVYSQPYAYDPNSPAIPIHTEAINGPGYNNAELWTIGQIYDQILSDLSDENIAALPAYSAKFDPTRPSQAAALMLRQRIHMAKLDWNAAIADGESISGFTLSNSVADMFDAPYYTNENIFSLLSTNTERGHNPIFYFNHEGGYIDTLNTRTGILTNPAYHLASDSRTAFIRQDPNSIGVDGQPNKDVWYEKYDEYSVRLEWTHLFRYAETLLNLAESYYNVGNESKAAELLNTVRSRSIPSGDIIDVLSLDGDNLKEAIYNERRAEFISEGLRGYDISRRAEDYVYPLSTKTGDAWNTKVVATPSDRSTYAWALPEYELQVNKSINN